MFQFQIADDVVAIELLEAMARQRLIFQQVGDGIVLTRSPTFLSDKGIVDRGARDIRTVALEKLAALGLSA